jgi:multidrug efflux pump subunit AcrA (membrane-fusion protein)
VIRNNKKNALTTLEIKKGPTIEAVYGIGIVTATHTYQLKIAAATTVAKTFVSEGEEVKQNQPLILLEGIPLFRAPFSGTVTSLPYKVGESVAPQTSILNLADLKNRYLVVNLEQQGALRVKRGQNVRINFESYRDKNFMGKVRTLFSNDNQFIVHIDLESLPEQILPGMSSDVAIEINRKDNVTLAPVASISGGKITVLRNGTQQVIPVQLGNVDGEWAEILKGDLEPGDQAILTTKK